jgi:hypothetical protein
MSIEEKARSAAHVRVLETADELRKRQAAFPSQKCRGTHTKWYGGLLICLSSRGRGGELGNWVAQLEVWWERGAGTGKRTWLEASGDLGLTSPVPPQRP